MKSSSLIDKGTSSIECHYSALGEKLCVVDKKKELLVNPVRSMLKGVSLPKDNFIQDSLLIFHPSDSLIVPGGRIVDSRVTYSYCGNYFYEGDSLARVSFDGGYISFTSSGIPKYHFYIKDHLGSVRAVLDANGSVEQYTHYYPFGCIIADKSTNQGLQPYKYNGKELERLYAVNLYDYGARWYDAAMSRWTSVDPLCEQYYETSPYAYCLNNPMKFVDMDGCNPIYGLNGTFLGTDEYGLEGNYLVMDEKDFIQGMTHASAGNYAFMGELSENVQNKIDSHYNSLSKRPDYDGFVTPAEGVAWAKQNPNALKHPTPDNTLYVNTSKLDFGNISTSSFPATKTKIAQDLFNKSNTLESFINPTLFATVYALGRVYLVLENRKNKIVRIVNDEATDYDWNEGGGKKRDTFIRAHNSILGINPKVHGFKVYYYGLGKLRR